MTERKKITFLTLVLSHYRVAVHERIRMLLAEKGIDYEVLYSDPTGANAQKHDTAVLPWAKKVAVRSVGIGSGKIHYQHAARAVRDSDLVIVSQENKLLLNYWLILKSFLLGRRIAFFGHGRGYQSNNPDGAREKFKRFFAKRVDWWFAYTKGVASYLETIGFPKDHITTFCNSIDTTRLRHELDTVGKADIEAFKSRYALSGKNTAIYIGGMYEEKRLDFLCESAILIRQQIPDFELLLIGNGSHAHIAKRYSEKHSFIHAPGQMFGKERATALKLAEVFLMPGLVGLAVIDSFVGECPIITTDYRFHSPEIEYLDSGRNGLIVPDDGKQKTYADAVAEILKDTKLRRKMRLECRKSGQLYSAENMANNLAEGMARAVAG